MRTKPSHLFLWMCVAVSVGTSGCTTFKKPDDGPREPVVTVGITASNLLPGDIVLRRGAGPDSELIADLTGSRWTHSGIIVQDGTQRFVIDNYPGRPGSSVAKISVDEFFTEALAGGVWRFDSPFLPVQVDRTKAVIASNWAVSQLGVRYQFDIQDLYTNNDLIQYCSELVWRAYIAAGENLVPAPLNLKLGNEARTRRALLRYGTAATNYPTFLVKPKVDEAVDKHNGLFIAPGQLDTSILTVQIR